MALPPPEPVPLAIVHDRAGVDAAVTFSIHQDRPIIILLAPQLAYTAGPAVAHAMIPDPLPSCAIVTLDCGDDPGVVIRAMECGWTRIVTTNSHEDILDRARSAGLILWHPDSLFGRHRVHVNLEPGMDPERALAALLD